MSKCRWPGILGLATAVAAGSLCLALVAADGGDWHAPSRAARKKNPIPPSAASIAAGQATYLKECRACHGDNGKGDGPAAKDLTKSPGDLTTAKFWEQTDGAIYWKITEGRKPMPSFADMLSNDQRWNVVNFIHSFAPKDKK